tara:strand:- start:11 stop:442 length:432 start_codon:yes stop_codon:yes gene_type:complete
MASGIARAASGASKSGLGGILGGATGVLKGNQGGGEMGGRIEGIESRIEALETSGGGMDAAAVGSIASAAPSTPGEAMADQAANVGGNITTGRFSDQALSTANQVFGGEQTRQASVGQIPAAVAGANEQTTNDISQMVKEQFI